MPVTVVSPASEDVCFVENCRFDVIAKVPANCGQLNHNDSFCSDFTLCRRKYVQGCENALQSMHYPRARSPPGVTKPATAWPLCNIVCMSREYKRRNNRIVRCEPQNIAYFPRFPNIRDASVPAPTPQCRGPYRPIPMPHSGPNAKQPAPSYINGNFTRRFEALICTPAICAAMWLHAVTSARSLPAGRPSYLSLAASRCRLCTTIEPEALCLVASWCLKRTC